MARSTPLQVFVHPADATMPGGGLFQITTASDIPAWATGSQDWAVGSFAANWQFFGDVPTTTITSVTDGTSNTIMYNEKYAIAKSGGAIKGATLWGYGIYPTQSAAQRLAAAGSNPATAAKFPTAPDGTNDYIWNKAYWARTGYVNNPGSSGALSNWPNSATALYNWEFGSMRVPNIVQIQIRSMLIKPKAFFVGEFWPPMPMAPSEWFRKVPTTKPSVLRKVPRRRSL